MSLVSSPWCCWGICANLFGNSCPTVRSLPIQHPSRPSLDSHQDHTRQAGSNHHTAGRGGLGGGEQHGGKEENRDRNGRIGKLRCNRHLGSIDSKFKMRSLTDQEPCIRIHMSPLALPQNGEIANCRSWSPGSTKGIPVLHRACSAVSTCQTVKIFSRRRCALARFPFLRIESNY